MKNIFILLAIAFILKSGNVRAQIPNAGFETLNSQGNVSNWGMVLLQAVIIDSLGVAHPDSIVFDNQLYFQTNDAHTGAHALEMRNGYDFTANEGITGGAILSPNDSDYSTFLTFVPIQSQPAVFSFYYKYFPVGSDSAVARVEVYDSLGLQLGDATIVIGGMENVYTLAITPINYSSPGTAAFISMNFRTQLDGLQPSFGTRFLVDDVSLDITPPAGTNNWKNANEVHVYPNPATNQVTISFANDNKKSRITLCDIAGHLIYSTDGIVSKSVEVNTSDFSAGFYLLQIGSDGFVETKKIIIEK